MLAQIEVRRRISSRVSISAEGEDVAASLDVKGMETVFDAPISSHRKGFTEKQCMYVLICIFAFHHLVNSARYTLLPAHSCH